MSGEEHHPIDERGRPIYEGPATRATGDGWHHAYCSCGARYSRRRAHAAESRLDRHIRGYRQLGKVSTT